MRGNIGIAAQFLMAGSAFFDGDNKTTAKSEGVNNYFQTRDGKAKIKTSVYGLIGNGINSIYGVQKDMDNQRLKYAKKLINKNITVRHEDAGRLLPNSDDTKRVTPTSDEPSWMEKNSIRFGSAIKLWSKRELFIAKDPNLKLSALFSIIGKIVSLTGLPEDPFHVEKKDNPIRKLRRQSNMVSSLFDWTSTFSLLMGAFRTVKDPNKTKEAIKADKKWYTLFDFKNTKWRWNKGNFFSKDNTTQWWQLTGAIAFAASLYAKSIAPFTVKKLDVDNLMSHTTLAIASGVNKNHAKELIQLTAQMMQTRELPEVHKQGFASTFTEVANRLEQHHNIALKPAKTQNRTLIADNEQTKNNKTVSGILKDKPLQSLTERVIAESNENSQTITSIS